MLRLATCLCVLQVLFALRDPEVAHLIPDQPTFIDTPTVPASSAIVTASEEVPQVQDLQMDLSKLDLAELEELPNCTKGELRLSARVYKVTRHVEIQRPCNVTADGTTLLVNTTLIFNETARLDGKLSVRAMNALQGPCLAFKSDAFVAASAELHFANCHNIVEEEDDDDFDRGQGFISFDLMQISALPAEAAEVDGGAMNVRGSLMVMGTLIIRDCRTKDGKGGAIAVKQHFVHSSGSISIINSSAGEDGGGIYVYRNFINSGGSLFVSGSSAEGHGGGIYVKKSFNNSGGNIKISNSSATRGGGITVYHNFQHLGGKIEISGSSAGYGGGIYVNNKFTNSGGNIKISNSSATRFNGGSSEANGGGITVYHNFQHLGGKIEISGSSAENGGGIFVERSFTDSGGKIEVAGSSAENGGGIYVKKRFTNSGGKIQISGSSATKYGGGIFVQGSFTDSGGRIEVAGSSAMKQGGGIYVEHNFAHLEGNIKISGSSAKEHGGGIYVYHNFANSGGEIQISGSSAKEYGGGIYVYRNFANSGGEIQISGSPAEYGGGIYVNHNFANSGGNIKISGSSAELRGGGIYVSLDFIHLGGSLSLSDSSTKTYGGGLYVVGNVVFANATASFSQCHAQLEGGGIMTPGNVSLTNASLMFELATAGDRGAAIQAPRLEQTGGDMTVYNSSASAEVISLTAWVIDGGIFHVQDCKADSFLVAAHEGARLHATEFVVVNSSAAGMLVSSGEVTMSNGKFNQTSSPQLRANVVKVTHLNVTGSEASISWASEESTVYDMDCDEAFGGYNRSDGIGCTKCDPGSVFVKNITEKTIANRSAVQHCVPCPDGARICNATAIKMLPGMMIERHNISRAWRCPNSLACEGGNVSSNASTEMCAEGYEDVGCAKCTNDCARSNSNVFICLKCAKGAWWRVKDYFLFFASDAVIFIISAAGVVSAGRQNKNSTVYLNQLMAFAAVTAPALVALRNTATFEHQLERLQQIFTFISFPVQAGDAGESATTVSTGCILRYLGLEPTLVLSQVLSSSVYVVLTLCLAVKSGPRVALVVGINCFLPKFCSAFGAYLICYRMEPAPLGQAHCLAGANPFFGMTVAVLAIIFCFAVGPGSWIRMTQDKSLKDEPQMGFFSFVLMASFGLHATQAPYTKDQWNKIELGLLVMALLVVNLTTMCLANEIHWAHSEEVQVTLIVVITVIVAIAGGLQSFLLIRELILERFPPLNAPEPMEPIEPTEGGEDVEVSKD